MFTSDGTLLVFMELSFDKTENQTGLSHCRLTKKHQFELADFALCGTIRSLCSSTGCCCCCSSLIPTIGHDSAVNWSCKQENISLQPCAKEKISQGRILIHIGNKKENLIGFLCFWPTKKENKNKKLYTPNQETVCEFWTWKFLGKNQNTIPPAVGLSVTKYKTRRYKNEGTKKHNTQTRRKTQQPGVVFWNVTWTSDRGRVGISILYGKCYT